MNWKDKLILAGCFLISVLGFMAAIFYGYYLISINLITSGVF